MQNHLEMYVVYMCAAVEKYGMSMEQHEYTKKKYRKSEHIDSVSVRQ